LQGAHHGVAATLVRWANTQPATVVALDVPSGLDTIQGTAYDPTIQAVATLTLALPKAGLLAPQAVRYVGELYLMDIGVPSELYAGPSLQLQVGPIFSASEILRLR
jgi:NAD(P)H-hydrate epimerase